MKQQLLEHFSEDDLAGKVQEKQKRFSGLLTEEAALRLVAKDHGLPLPPKETVIVPLARVSAGETATVKVRLLAAMAPKAFEREGRKGKVCNVSVVDASSGAVLVLWNQDVWSLNKIQRNDVLLLKDVFVKTLNPLEIHSRMSTEIIVAQDDPSLPKSRTILSKLSEAKGEEIDVAGRVLEKEELKRFERNGKQGSLFRFVLADSSGKKTIVAWDENASEAARAKVGDGFKAEGAYEKQGELHVSRKGRVLLNPPLELPSMESFYPKKTLSELGPSDAIVEAVISNVSDAQKYFKCSCGKRNVLPECPCGGQSKGVSFVSFALKDDSAEKRAVMFGEPAKDFLGVQDGFDWNTFVALKKDYLVNKPIRIIAFSRKSGFSGENEVVGKHVLA